MKVGKSVIFILPPGHGKTIILDFLSWLLGYKVPDSLVYLVTSTSYLRLVHEERYKHPDIETIQSENPDSIKVMDF